MINEQQINNMSYLFFEDVLAQLGHRLNYEAIVNYAGNSFCEKSWEMIMDNNPFNVSVDGKENKGAMRSLAGFFSQVQIKGLDDKKGKGKVK